MEYLYGSLKCNLRNWRFTRKKSIFPGVNSYEEVKHKELPTTSQPPVGHFVELYERLAQDYNALICVHLSSGISGTYQGAVTLQVKPLLYFENKVIVPYEKIRTRKKAMKRIVDLLGEDALSGDSFRAVIIHANREEEAREWRDELTSLYPNVDFTIGYFGAVIGTHLGEGAMGMGWMKK